MEKRKKHCSMVKLNIFGRCIAQCASNDYDEDCTGKKRVPAKELARLQNEERNLH